MRRNDAGDRDSAARLDASLGTGEPRLNQDGGQAAGSDGTKREVEVTIAKWYDNHRAAISLNYDGTAGTDPVTVQQVLAHGLHLDYEFVTTKVSDELAVYIKNVLLPEGIGFFGHGYEHVNHDRLTYDEAFTSASKNRQTLIDLGIPPVAFAYPGGHGVQAETQAAIRDAGFLMARGHSIVSNPYIAADDETEPHNWYLLPDLVMESYDYQQDARRVNDTQDLIPFLDGALQRTAWIILTYHAIGNTKAFGFYYREDFESDLDAIAARDFWPANSSAATLYLRERPKALATATWYFGQDHNTIDRIEVYVEDGLPNDLYNQPLTLLFDIPQSWIGEPIEIQGPDGRLPDQLASGEHAQFSLAPAEAKYTLRIARTLYPVSEEGDAGAEPIAAEQPAGLGSSL